MCLNFVYSVIINQTLWRNSFLEGGGRQKEYVNRERCTEKKEDREERRKMNLTKNIYF